MVRPHGVQNGVGQRRHGAGHAERDDQHHRKRRRPVAAARVDTGDHHEAQCHEQRASGQWSSRAELASDATQGRRRQRDDDRYRQQGRARGRGRVAGDLDQHIRHQHQQGTQPTVEEKRHQRQPHEARLGKELQRHHRALTALPLYCQEQREQHRPDRQRRHRQAVQSVRTGSSGEPPGQARQPCGSEQRAGHIERAMIHARRVLHKAQRKGERCGGDRHVD